MEWFGTPLWFSILRGTMLVPKKVSLKRGRLYVQVPGFVHVMLYEKPKTYIPHTTVRPFYFT